MLELATLAASFLAFALLHAAEPHRRPLRLRSPAPVWRHLSRLLSGMLLLFSIACWTRVEGAPAAILVVLTMFSTSATLFALAVPVVPCLVWGTALACALSLPLLSWLGGSGG